MVVGTYVRNNDEYISKLFTVFASLLISYR